MREIFKAVIVWSLIIGGIFYIGSCNKKKAEDSETRRKAYAEKHAIEYYNIDNEDLILLSLKYNLDKNKIYNLINEYQLLVFGFSEDYKFKPAENKEIIEVSVAIDNLSSKYNIPKEVIANILLDKKSLESKPSD